MAEIINLRMARKARRRADEAASAAVNRARHGQPKSARHAAAQEATRLARNVEGARLDSARDMILDMSLDTGAESEGQQEP